MNTQKKVIQLKEESNQVAIHTANPMMKYTDGPSGEPVEMTEAEVRTTIQDWIEVTGE